MTIKSEVKISREALSNPIVSDEYFFRQLACEMVTKMPIDELHKLIRFTKTDPNTIEVRAKIRNEKTPEHERERLIILRRQYVVLYEAEVELP
jgi:hypothetical protein